MRYFVDDAFTSEAFGGNPAGVVLLGLGGSFPSDRLMQQVAAELRYSETAFVRQEGPTEFTVRYFTPAGEVDLCGHATIATFGVLRHEGVVPEGALCLNHTLAGDLEVNIGQQVMMEMAAPQVIEKQVDVNALHRIMMGPGHPVAPYPALPVEIVSTGLPDIMMPLASVDDLNNLQPDMGALSALSCDLDVTGVHAFAIADDGYTAPLQHTRGECHRHRQRRLDTLPAPSGHHPLPHRVPFPARRGDGPPVGGHHGTRQERLHPRGRTEPYHRHWRFARINAISRVTTGPYGAPS